MLVFLLFLSLFLLFWCLILGEPPVENVRKFLARRGLSTGSAVLCLLVGSLLFGTPVAGLFWGLLGWHLPDWITGYIEEKKRARLRALATDFVAAAAGLYAAGQLTPEVVKTAAERFPEPLASDFEDMIAARNMNPYASFPRMFETLAEKRGLPEFRAVAAIVAASERAGGPASAANGLKRLGRALRQRDELLAERAKATLEPRMAAYVTVLILLGGLFLDATLLRHFFEGPGKLVLAAASGLVVGLAFMVRKIAKQDDLL